MKKYIDHIKAMTSDKMHAHVTTLRVDISTTSRGIKQGDVQNVHIVRAKRKELARTLTLLNATTVADGAHSVNTKKETK